MGRTIINPIFKGTIMKRSIKVFVGILLAFWFIPASTLAGQKLIDGIEFLDNVNKVAWYKTDGKNIIVGWKGLPDNFYNWNYKTALHASKLSQYKIYVWAVRYHQKDWSPGEGGQICITTATRGRFGKTNCK